MYIWLFSAPPGRCCSCAARCLCPGGQHISVWLVARRVRWPCGYLSSSWPSAARPVAHWANKDRAELLCRYLPGRLKCLVRPEGHTEPMSESTSSSQLPAAEQGPGGELGRPATGRVARALRGLLASSALVVASLTGAPVAGSASTRPSVSAGTGAVPHLLPACPSTATGPGWPEVGRPAPGVSLLTGGPYHWYRPGQVIANRTTVLVAEYTEPAELTQGNRQPLVPVVQLNADTGKLEHVYQHLYYPSLLGPAPSGATMALWGQDLFVPSGEHQVTEVDITTHRVVRVLSAPQYHFDLPANIVTDGRDVFVLNVAGNLLPQLAPQPGRYEFMPNGNYHGTITEFAATTGALVHWFDLTVPEVDNGMALIGEQLIVGGDLSRHGASLHQGGFLVFDLARVPATAVQVEPQFTRAERGAVWDGRTLAPYVSFVRSPSLAADTGTNMAAYGNDLFVVTKTGAIEELRYPTWAPVHHFVAKMGKYVVGARGFSFGEGKLFAATDVCNSADLGGSLSVFSLASGAQVQSFHSPLQYFLIPVATAYSAGKVFMTSDAATVDGAWANSIKGNYSGTIWDGSVTVVPG